MADKGPRPEYNSPLALKKAVERYFEACEAKGTFPDFAGMKLALRLTDAKIKEWKDSKTKNHEEYEEIFEYARDRRESWLVRRMTESKNSAPGCMSALKQPINGGYTDRPIESGEKTLNVNVAGLGGMDLFK